MIGAIESGVNCPPGDRGWKVPSKGDVYKGTTYRSLEGGGSATVLNMKAVAEEEVLKVRTTGVLVGAIQCTMGVRIQRKKKTRKMLIDIANEAFEPVGDDWKGNVQVDTRHQHGLQTAVEENHFAIPIAQMCHLLRLKVS